MPESFRDPRRILATAAVLLAATAPAGAGTGAYDLLAEVREAYEGLASYRDRGEIEIVEAGAPARTLAFETYLEGDVFRLLVEDGGGVRRVLSREGGEIRLDDLDLGQYRKPDSLGTGLVEVLGQKDFDALAVATTVAGSPAALSQPEGAALEGLEPCGESTCDLLALSRLQGDHETLLWIDRDSRRIRRLEIVVRSGDSLRQAVSEAGLKTAPATAAPGRRTFRVRLDSDLGPSELAGYAPPTEARGVADWERPATAPEVRSAGPDDLPTLVFDDAVSVELFTLTTRVVDSRGRPLADLRPEDFLVLAGKDEVPVVSADWVSSDPAHRDPELEAQLRREGVELEPEEKLVVVFVQAGMHRSRIRGHQRTLPYFEEFLETLQPTDRVALVAFDSHLDLWLDFTRRHREAREALGDAIRFGSEPRLRRRGQTDPSLARHFDFRAARDAATPEQALEVVGRALEPIPGEKMLVYLGWGMGRFGAGGVRMTADFEPAVSALQRARTSVFVLDVTDAAYHSLEIGLQNVAAQTGGTYDKTSLFPQQATDRLAGTLTGHYVLTLDGADLPAEEGLLRIGLREKKGRVVGDTFRIDRP